MLPRRPDITGSLATSGAFQNKSTETKLSVVKMWSVYLRFTCLCFLPAHLPPVIDVTVMLPVCVV